MKNKGLFLTVLLLAVAALFAWTGCRHDPAPELITTFPVPVNVLTRSSDAQISVTWDGVEGASRYEVSYGVGDAFDKTTAVTGTSANLTGLLKANEYQIRVRAGNGKHWSNWSSPTRATPKSPTAEVVMKRGVAAYEVLNIDAWHGGDTSESNIGGVVMISWNPTEGAESYQVFVAEATKFRNESAPNSRYGSDGVYDTEFGDVLPATGNVAIPPNRPETPKADNLKTTSYFYRGAESGKTYYMWVRAKNAQGYGDATMYPAPLLNPNKTIESGSAWGDGIERADYPKNVKMSTREGSVTVSWDAADRAVWYEVYYSASDISGLQIRETGNAYALVPYQKLSPLLDAGSAAYPWNHEGKRRGEKGKTYKIYSLETTITGLETGKPCYIWIRSLNHNGERGLAQVVVSPNKPLPAPANVGMTAEKTTLTVNWDAVDGADAYRVYLSKFASTPDVNAQYYPAKQNSHTLENMDANTTYYVWVVAEVKKMQGDFSASATAKTGTSSGLSGKVAKKTLNGDDFANILYVEINDSDPRVALGYVLNDTDKTQYFDAVILFAANLRVRNCKAEKDKGEKSHDCYKNGPHIHLNGNVAHVLSQRDKYIKPLQDAGIKVLLGTLPDHDNFSYYSLFQWPFEDDYKWNTDGNPGKAFHSSWYSGDSSTYPFAAVADPVSGKTYSEVFMDDLVGVINEYGLDGFDVDNEYASDGWVKGLSIRAGLDGDYDNVYSTTGTVKWALGQNLVDFLMTGRKKMDETTPPGAPKKWITIFEYSVWASSLTGMFGVTANGEVARDNLHKYINYSYEGVYDQWSGISSNGMPKDKYGPYSVNIWRVNPSLKATADSQMARVLNQRHGCMMYFAPASIRDIGKMAGYSKLNGKTQAEYLSWFSQPLFGKDVIYIGQDYPQDWARR